MRMNNNLGFIRSRTLSQLYRGLPGFDSIRDRLHPRGFSAPDFDQLQKGPFEEPVIVKPRLCLGDTCLINREAATCNRSAVSQANSSHPKET